MKRLFLCLFLCLTFSLVFAQIASERVTLRAWQAQAESVPTEVALLALQTAAAVPMTRPEFDVAANQQAWYALALPQAPSALPRVLELSHPAIESSQFFLQRPGQALQALAPVNSSKLSFWRQARFSATVLLPDLQANDLIVLSLRSSVPLRGEFVVQSLSDWTLACIRAKSLVTLCFGVAVLAAMWMVFRAWQTRSIIHALYGLLTLAIALATVIYLGYDLAEPGLNQAPARVHLSSSLAILASALVLFFAERALALDVQVPLFFKLLRLLGLFLLVATVWGYQQPPALHLWTSNLAVATAVVAGLSSLALTWKSIDRVAIACFAGFMPLIIGVSVVTLAMVGEMAFAPWILLAIPVGCLLEIPFNTWALVLIERRLREVQTSLAQVAQIKARVSASRQAMLADMKQTPIHALGSFSTLLIMLRFEGFTPGSANLRRLDAVAVERYFHAMLAVPLQLPANIGRWSFHEIAMRVELHNAAERDQIFSVFFAQDLRGETFGIRRTDSQLRIAFGYIRSEEDQLEVALNKLSAALDKNKNAEARRLNVDLHRDVYVD